jgi:hypothetical protein
VPPPSGKQFPGTEHSGGINAASPYLSLWAPCTQAKFLEKPKPYGWRIFATWAPDVNNYYVLIQGRCNDHPGGVCPATSVHFAYTRIEGTSTTSGV